jgi:hypothetical protein
MEPEFLLPCEQQHTTVNYPEPVQSTPHSRTLFLQSQFYIFPLLAHVAFKWCRLYRNSGTLPHPPGAPRAWVGMHMVIFTFTPKCLFHFYQLTICVHLSHVMRATCP